MRFCLPLGKKRNRERVGQGRGVRKGDGGLRFGRSRGKDEKWFTAFEDNGLLGWKKFCVPILFEKWAPVL